MPGTFDTMKVTIGQYVLVSILTRLLTWRFLTTRDQAVGRIRYLFSALCTWREHAAIAANHTLIHMNLRSLGPGFRLGHKPCSVLCSANVKQSDCALCMCGNAAILEKHHRH